MNKLFGNSAASILAVGVMVSAPSATGAEAASTAAATSLEEVVVTARRQSESLQRTPVAVSAITGEGLENRNIRDMAALSGTVPNLSIQQQPNTASGISLTIRGIGGNADNKPAFDTGTSIYLNGILLPRPSQNLIDLVDLERVEVLRGPQGTLFGRNTTGGLINLVTRAPSTDRGYSVKVGYASENEMLGQVAFNTGTIPGTDLAARIIYQHRQKDGYSKVPGRPGRLNPGATNSDSAMFTIGGNLGQNLTAQFTADYAHSKSVAPATQLVEANANLRTFFAQSPLLGGQPLTIYPKKFVKETRTSEDLPPIPVTNWGVGLTLDYSLSDTLSFKSLTGYRDGKAETRTDQGGGQAGLVANFTYLSTGRSGVMPVALLKPIFDALHNPYPQQPRQEQHSHSFTQEFQLAVTRDDLKAVGGVFYLTEEVFASGPAGFLIVAANGQSAFFSDRLQTYTVKNRSYAAYGQASFKPAAFDQRLELTGGLRYTVDKKRGHDIQTTNRTPVPGLNRHVAFKFDYLSFNSSISYQWTEDFMTYVRVGNASKAGGYNPGDVATGAFRPERALVYEAGFRSELLDRRLRLNTTFYNTDFTDQQVQVLDTNAAGSITRINNAGKSRYQGVEIELVAAPAEGLVLDASLGYDDAKFKNYPYLGVNQAARARVPYAPKWTGHVGAQYSFPETSMGVPSVRVDFSYRSTFVQYALDLQNPYTNVINGDPTRKLDVRFLLSDIPLGGGTARGRLEFYIDNVLDQHPVAFNTEFAGLGWAVMAFQRGRVIGFTGKAEF